MSAAPGELDAATPPEPARFERSVRVGAAFGLIGMFLGCLSQLTVVDLDLFHELSLAREVLHLGRLPREDSFAYTPTVTPVVHHEWGAGVVVYLATISTLAGGPGLMLLRYALSLLVAAGCFLNARSRGATWSSFSFLAPLAISMGWGGFSTIRALLFSLAFLVCLLLILVQEARHRSWWLCVWLPLYVLWLNMHAGVLVGLGLFGVYTLERFVREAIATGSLWSALGRVRSLAGCCLAMVILLLTATPYGVDYAIYLWHAVRMPRPLITEWMPLWQVGSWGDIMFFAVSVLSLLYVVFVRRVRDLQGITLLLPTAVLAFQHQRHLPIYAVVWLCLVPAWLGPTTLGRALEQVWRDRVRFLLAVWVICGIAGGAYSIHKQCWVPRIPTMARAASEGVPIYPVGAADYLAANRFQGNVMVPFEVGAFVSWRLYPAVRVSIDSRYEVAYPPRALEESVDFYRAKDGWTATLTRYETDAVLVPWKSPVGEELADAPDYTGRTGWQRVYTDNAYSVFLRKSYRSRFPVVDRSGEEIVGSFP